MSSKVEQLKCSSERGITLMNLKKSSRGKGSDVHNLWRIGNEMNSPSRKQNDLNSQVGKTEWLTVDDAAVHFQTSSKTVRKWLYERRLRYYKVGGLVRIHRSDLKKFPVLFPTANEILDSRDG